MYGRLIVEFMDKEAGITAQASVGFESSAREGIDEFAANFSSITDMSMAKVFTEASERFKKAKEAKTQPSLDEQVAKVEEAKEKKKKKIEQPALQVEKPEDKKGVQAMIIPDKNIHV